MDAVIDFLVAKLTRDYFARKRMGTPRVDPDHYPELEGRIDRDIWRR